MRFKVRINPVIRYKGVVAIDLQLEGVKMRLRPSMKKFDVPNAERAEIEIVQPFGYPIRAYLNRCLLFANFRRLAVFLKIVPQTNNRRTRG